MAVSTSFSGKIYQILQNESQHIVQWNESGLSFRIVDNRRFEREIVPKYFRRKISVRSEFPPSSQQFSHSPVHCFTDSQASSVQRQLHMHGFRRVRSGAHKGSYVHPVFKRSEWKTPKTVVKPARCTSPITPATVR
jgi:hypothetical protein